jgi:hypothetical protein
MAFYHQPQSPPPRFGVALSSFMQHTGLPFAEVLPDERIQQAFDDAGVTGRIGRASSRAGRARRPDCHRLR